MQITSETVEHMAKLANLNIPNEKIEEYKKNLQDILEFAQIINGLDTNNIGETIGANGNQNIFRKDEVKPFGDREKLLENAPSQDDGMFRIPKVIS